MANEATHAATPRPRRYKFRANAKCGRPETGGVGAFAHDHIVYEGDEFFLTLAPALVKARDKDGKPIRDERGAIKRVLVDRAFPTWADPIAEYPLEAPPKPIRTMIPETAPVTVAGAMSSGAPAKP